MKIVVACDSFKDSLSSAEVNAALKSGILTAVPEAEVICVSVGDGGEGTAEVLVRQLGGQWRSCRVTDPLGRPVDARYGTVETGMESVALIEMAEASGLQLLTADERDAMHTSSAGLGEMILDAYRNGCREFLVCIGGSATCDAGMGMLTALGLRFTDASGSVLHPCGEALEKVANIDEGGCLIDLKACRFTVICDVTNPLFGQAGAAFVYGPQKGATPAEVETLDRGLRHLADVVKRSGHDDFSAHPGSGAAGGIGYAFKTFLGAELKPGVEAVLDMVEFDSHVRGADLVITGEGHIDSQTLSGKLPYGVCRRASAVGVPTVAVAGAVDSVPELLESGFAGIFPIICRPMTLTEALQPDTARRHLRVLGSSLARLATALTLPRPAQNQEKHP